MAGQTATRRHPHRPASPARSLPAHLQHRPATPSPRRPHSGRVLPSHPERRPTELDGAGIDGGHYRIRLDRIDANGKVSLRRAGRMHHLGVGYAQRGQPVLVLIDATTATVTHRTTGEILSEHDIDPTRSYWRNKQREPGRWPGSQR